MTAMTGTCCPIRNVNVHPLSTCTCTSPFFLCPPPPSYQTALTLQQEEYSAAAEGKRPASHRDRRCEAGRREGSREGGRQVGREAGRWGGREGGRVRECLRMNCCHCSAPPYNLDASVLRSSPAHPACGMCSSSMYM